MSSFKRTLLLLDRKYIKQVQKISVMHICMQRACPLSFNVYSAATLSIDFKLLLPERGGGLNCLGQRCREWREREETERVHLIACDGGGCAS